ncbi:golgin subfamily A member 6-like protein 24 [Mercenaria mercenaria]|uniref:golgin subfamily A member 6-like protein 24 n=1 Tax=Mercenaria mercenaria TaxID=6596 RepID=UPI00234F52A6|nr:golgin subfamily A member 6-like protein 24 [Mercenaria mercenaria]
MTLTSLSDGSNRAEERQPYRRGFFSLGGMAKNRPPGARLIEVKPVADDGKKLPPLKSKNENAMEKLNVADRNKSKLIIVKPKEVSEHESQLAEIDSSFQEVELTYAQHVKDQPIVKEEKVQEAEEGANEDEKVKEQRNEIKKKRKRIKKNSVLPLDVTSLGYLEGNSEEPKYIGEPDSRLGKKKKATKKDKSKKNKKKKEKTEQVVKAVETTRGPEQEIVAVPPQNDKQADDEKKTRKLPCCFGFFSTWLAKRKQKRRDKKKKAIADRCSPPKLVQYEHKKAKGGEAFIIEVDSRPVIQKPLLPPIKQTAGPIRRGIDLRLRTAEARREDELAKRREAVRKYERKKIECKERKADADYHFRKKAGLTIRYKQADAERNRNNLSRCATIARPASIQSSSSESVIIENDPDAFKVDENDPDAWKVDGVDCFTY